MKLRTEDAVSPVIGVMLMIVVTVIIAAVVSGFAGGYSDEDRKAPTAVISCRATDNKLLFTHESGDFVDLVDCNIILTNGEETRSFAGIYKLEKVSPRGSTSKDTQITTGNQFYLTADNDGSGSGVDGAYLGWDDPDFYLTIDEIGTYKVIERESGQIISEGVIAI
ncbi:type IV pilin [Methanolacinia paynteri]|uniref:type IV pilin n=1 Tax=Methanolacinia paynteri TaxID=230356 RepID=UPI000695060F|nr:type IV pilin N-terminal domain-containing protein [Methanolacinia paynteri]